MDARQLEGELDKYGELHAYLDSGKELHLHDRDVDVHPTEDWAIIDSKKGRWGFHPSKIEYVEYPESEV